MPTRTWDGYAGGMIRIGCSGWNYRHWRGDVYPQRLPAREWLPAYAARFDTVEVNTTFYRLPERESVARWVQQTPDGFLFAIKASRYLTHVKRLTDVPAGIAHLYERIAPLVEDGRLAAVLWQLPATFRRDDERLARTLDALPEGRHAFEFRDASWFCDTTLDALAARDVALVRGEDARRELPEVASPASWDYVRLHYGREGPGGDYAPAELDTLARELALAAGTGRDVLAYFNNDWEGFAPRNAEGLRARLGGAATPAAGVPPALTARAAAPPC
ncbi:MAG: hypothetical protein JWM31_3543 [Solirubrobacterales bacterium]|nr:hypothetical protein [Solirubrobacterales bacterium]